MGKMTEEQRRENVLKALPPVERQLAGFGFRISDLETEINYQLKIVKDGGKARLTLSGLVGGLELRIVELETHDDVSGEGYSKVITSLNERVEKLEKRPVFKWPWQK